MGALIMGPLMPGLLQNMGSLKLGFPVLGSLEAAQRSFEYTYLFHYHFSRYTVFPDIPYMEPCPQMPSSYYCKC